MRVDFVGVGPIRFEGVELPEVAKGFELVPFWEELPQDTRDWLMDLHYCWGRTRRHASYRVLRHVRLVRFRLTNARAYAAENLRLRFPEATPAELDQMVEDWFKSLEIIEERAKRTRICAWTILAQDESLDANLTVAIKMCREGVGGAPPLAPDLTPGFEFRVRNLPRERQLEWLASFTDSFTRKESAWRRFCNQASRLFTPAAASQRGDVNNEPSA